MSAFILSVFLYLGTIVGALVGAIDERVGGWLFAVACVLGLVALEVML